MKRTRLMLAIPLVALAIAGCGGSSPASPAASSSAASTGASSSSPSTSTGQANSVCATFNAQVAAVTGAPNTDPTTATADQLPALATYLDQLVPIVEQEDTGLTQASDGAPLSAPFLTFASALDDAASAAHGSDAAAFVVKWNEFVAAQKAVKAAATAANLPDCAK